jgi:hypothetical protein
VPSMTALTLPMARDIFDIYVSPFVPLKQAFYEWGAACSHAIGKTHFIPNVRPSDVPSLYFTPEAAEFTSKVNKVFESCYHDKEELVSSRAMYAIRTVTHDILRRLYKGVEGARRVGRTESLYTILGNCESYSRRCSEDAAKLEAAYQRLVAAVTSSRLLAAVASRRWNQRRREIVTGMTDEERDRISRRAFSQRAQTARKLIARRERRVPVKKTRFAV